MQALPAGGDEHGVTRAVIAGSSPTTEDPQRAFSKLPGCWCLLVSSGVRAESGPARSAARSCPACRSWTARARWQISPDMWADRSDRFRAGSDRVRPASTLAPGQRWWRCRTIRTAARARYLKNLVPRLVTQAAKMARPASPRSMPSRTCPLIKLLRVMRPALVSQPLHTDLDTASQVLDTASQVLDTASRADSASQVPGTAPLARLPT